MSDPIEAIKQLAAAYPQAALIFPVEPITIRVRCRIAPHLVAPFSWASTRRTRRLARQARKAEGDRHPTLYGQRALEHA